MKIAANILWKRLFGKDDQSNTDGTNSPRRVSNKVVPGLPRVGTFKTQQSDLRDKLETVKVSPGERRTVSMDARRIITTKVENHQPEAPLRPATKGGQTEQNNVPGGSGVVPESAPAPIPATTPLIVRQDHNGVQWIPFEYSRDRVKMEYTIRCDVESVNGDDGTDGPHDSRQDKPSRRFRKGRPRQFIGENGTDDPSDPVS